MEDIVEIIELDVPDPASPTSPDPTTGAEMDGDAIYRLATDAKTRVRTLRLRPALWDCLLKVNGRRDAAAIARELDRPLARVLADLDRLSLIGIVLEPGAISLQKHLYPDAAAPATPAEGAAAARPAANAPRARARISTDRGDCGATDPRSLQCLLRLIRGRHGSGRRGELAVYRIFTAVPRRLFEIRRHPLVPVH